MNYRNKLMSLSLIALAVFSACTNEMENGTHPGKGDQRLSFAVSMGGTNAWKPTAGTRAASDLGESTYELEPVEMEGKVNGKTVYLTAEVTEGFPGDNHPMTRGTQITETNKKDLMKTFGVSAYTDQKGTPDYMYNEEATLDTDGYWYPTGTYYWPAKKQLSFYAWYPSAADGMTLTDNTHPGAPVMTYIVPDDVKKQQDVMSAVVIGKDNPTLADGFATTDLTFNHALSAVKFVAGDDLPNCVVKSIKLDGVRYKGTYTLGTDAWTLTDDTQAFTLRLNKVVAGNGGAITEDGKGETLFMMPQTLSDDAKIEVVLNDGTADFTVGASIGGTKWEMGKTYTYHISNNFVSLVTTNDKFVAFTDETLTDQVAFFLSASATTAGTTGEILASVGVTVTPTTFASGASNLPVKVTWPKDMGNYVSMDISFAGKKKRILMSRQTPTEGDAYWLYSLPETTSQHLENDIIGLQNASESDWIAMTSSPTYSKDNYSQVIYDNSSKGDIYLQTLSIPSANRFASLLATKEDFDQNVMYCVEQKAFTADFGFKGCERNISRESEKWNIVLNGGHFKEDVTNLKARVVISSDVSDELINDQGRDLTYGEPVSIVVNKTTSMAVSATPYVKKRWDNQQNNTANNGTRKVNVQVKNDGMDEWYDCGPDGLMSDRFTWGNNFAIGYNQYHGKGNNWNNGALPIVRDYYEVHQKHPMFGLHRWSIMRDNGDANIMGNALYMIFCSARQWNGWNNGSIYRNSTSGGWSYIACNQANSITDPENPNYNDVYNGGRFITIGVKDRNWRWSSWQNYPGPLTVWIPVVYTDSHCGLNARPTDGTPIPGTSVNE
ncbi:fimbrillin family protein [Phocaeicola vulgatus]|uniref:Fimbrillin family protein n=1 Tax=Phocaeicola vulgatus TaxID=821 RepID=A0A6I1AV69_PHOVU|nr:fimbrillin family protein [Phocaeicola vulgatus]KAB6608628.1 fimbrillin family protein [Phocaeicola vulgatus]KAB6611846.1 fimbrillin family protein [Phocaeicola vulgatus]KAB6614040.1 fimbrillin family protein [Phocaeicola vulgatus]KAB6624063.1 fimbrillin family protein [Phocaeicola vulgatus]